MLVLSRKTNESVIIGNEIEVIVLDIREGTVKLGIKAPLDVSIHRQEIYEEIKAENIRALSNQEGLNKASEALKGSIPKKNIKQKQRIVDENKRAKTSQNRMNEIPKMVFHHILPQKPPKKR